MPFGRSRSQSSSTPQTTTVLTGLQQWRRRHTSTTAPSSPLPTFVTTSDNDSFPTSAILSRSSTEHAIQLNQPCHDTSTTNQEHTSTLSTNSSDASLYTTVPATNTTAASAPTVAGGAMTTTGIDKETANTIRIRLIPNVELTSRCFVFDIIDRILTPTTLLKIGRYSERHAMSDRLSFKSKVVSRAHAELWMDARKKIYIRDIGSSSGTFINRVRLSRSHETSQPMELVDGDIIQLGVDYQGGMDQKYLAVKIRLEINKDTTKTHAFRRHAFQQFQQLFWGISFTNTNASGSTGNTGDGQLDGDQLSSTTGFPGQQYDHHGGHDLSGKQQQQQQQQRISDNAPYLQECCICLDAIAPMQALFISPCSHIYHFKCLRPILLQHYPGFSCPLCRNYYDMEASIAIEYGPPRASSTTTGEASASTGTTPLPIVTSSSIMQHSSPSPSLQQNNHHKAQEAYGGEERQYHNQLGRRRAALFTENMDGGHLLASTAMDSSMADSMVDQDGVFGNVLSFL